MSPRDSWTKPLLPPEFVLAFFGFLLNFVWEMWAVPFAVYLGIGIAITVVMEHLAIEILDRWSYAEGAPALPLLGTGLAPLLQWLLLPPLALSLTRRHLRVAH